MRKALLFFVLAALASPAAAQVFPTANFGGGSMAVGSPVGSCDPNAILFCDASSALDSDTGLTYSGGVVTAAGGVSVGGGLTLSGSASNGELGANFLSGDGDDEGLSIDSSGNATLSGTTTFSGNAILSGTGANIALGSNYLSGDGADEGVGVTAAGLVVVSTTGTGDPFTVKDGASKTVLRVPDGGGLEVQTTTETFGTAPEIKMGDGAALTLYGGEAGRGAIVVQSDLDTAHTFLLNTGALNFAIVNERGGFFVNINNTSGSGGFNVYQGNSSVVPLFGMTLLGDVRSAYQGAGTNGAQITELHDQLTTGSAADGYASVGKVRLEADDGNLYDSLVTTVTAVDNNIATNLDSRVEFSVLVADVSTEVLQLDGVGASVTGAVSATSTITSSAAADIGWTIATAADQACNTTCASSACVPLGYDSGAPGVYLACTDATADVCVCAGA